MKRVLKWGFGLYCLFMLWLLLGQRMGEPHWGGVNLQPFYTIGNYFYVMRHPYSDSILRHVTVNLVGNVVMFIPLGLFLPGIWKRQRNVLIFLPTVTGIVAAIELTQLVSGLGSMDVDDMILNVPGALLGWLGYHIFRWFFRLGSREGRSQDSAENGKK